MDTKVEPVEERKFIFVDVGHNNNKFWHIAMYPDNSVQVEWGRVGEVGSKQTKRFVDSLAAQKFFNSKCGEKERKGYTPQKTMGAMPIRVTGRLREIAMKEIEGDDHTQKLVDYLVKVNIHQIEATTNIRFNAGTGAFTTPLGVVTEEGIREAQALLKQMGDHVVQHEWDSSNFMGLINNYMRIVPQNIGRGKPDPRALYPDITAIQEQQQILDSLKVSLQNAEQHENNAVPRMFRVKLTLIPDDGATGSTEFRRILRKYRESLNQRHVAARLNLKRIYRIEIAGMTEAYENDGAKLNNIMELWHGTRAANLLSMMKGGYVIPRNGGSIAITGRMFGDGVYFSDQSTKSLNYAYGYWGGGRYDSNCYMLLNDVAMGKYYIPRRSFTGNCPSGYDSTFAKAGQSGVINNEMVVYRTSQINPKFLCEFGA